MYYLAKFCRICIKTDVDLLDVESDDIDSIKLSEKLEQCAKMVICKESLSTKICTQCVKKLRISYDFQKMCKKSNSLLQGLLSELINDSDKITPENFLTSEIRVTLSPLKLTQQSPRKRITKTERCSILKSLLSCKSPSKPTKLNNIQKGGLRDIIAFTKNFDFGFVEGQKSSNPLSKLIQFSENFFKRDFTEFQETVLFIIENNNYLEEEDAMFNTSPEETKQMPFEEVVIEPDIRVKLEFTDEDQQFDENFNCDNSQKDMNHDVVVKEESIEEELEYVPSIISKASSHLDYITQSDPLRTFPKNSIRCRTRGNPYINPQLKKQFMLRSFQCKSCPRYFKTPGYLKAHCVKIHNALN